MNITIQIPDEQASVLQRQAESQGLTVDRWLLALAEQNAPEHSPAVLLQSNPREWTRQFREWAEGHDPGMPVLSDYAMSRESIYDDTI